MLFAAGFGTRMAPLTDTRPKPLVSVGGTALLDHARQFATPDIVDTIVVNTHYRGDQIKDHLAGTDIIISDETDTLLDTGGGLKKAIPLLTSQSVFTLNTDAIWTGQNPLQQLKDAWLPDDMDALLLLSHPKNATGHKGEGDFTVSETGRLSRGAGAVFLGAQVIKSSAIANIPEAAFSLNTVWNKLIASGRLYGVFHEGGWCDVGYPEAIPVAEKLLSGG